MTKLSSTSALVLLWAGREHLAGQRAGVYLDKLDLKEGRALLDTCDAICPYYAEVIRNRKRGVRDFIEQILSESTASKVMQIVIAGAGLDPLGMDLAEAHPGTRIFEVDRDNMELKARLTVSGPEAAPEYVTADLSDPAAVTASLRSRGWNPDTPTFLVLEGISYYLAPAALRDLVHALRPEFVVAEYLKPESHISAERAGIPARVFGAIAGECALPAIHRHDAIALSGLLGMTLVARHGMFALEKARTAENRWFSTEADGWIEVSLLRGRVR